MKNDYYRKINLARLIINVYTDGSFKNIRSFIDKFTDAKLEKENKEVRVIFSKGKRGITLSDSWNSLSIIGDTIDDLSNPFNLIGITQALFRFAAIHLAQKGTFLLHGSTAVLDDKTICFGDDGGSTAKTLGSLEIALDSKKYVADEFCFFDSRSKQIFGYQFIPIHIRPVVKEHLENYHKFSIPKNHYKESSAGEFIEQDKLFKTTPGKLAALVYIHFSKNAYKIEKLSTQEAMKAFKFCITSHIAKLLNPNLDRMQFSSMTDTNYTKVIDRELMNEILTKIINGKELTTQVLEQIPSYRLTISQPCQITSLLRKEIF
jgi:hypothetical protein